MPRTRHNKRRTLHPLTWFLLAAAAVLLVALAVAFTVDVKYAEGADLDDLAQCESGGNPSAETGNGFSGAFQFLPQTWRDLGYEGRPSDHSYETQRAAAAQVIRGSTQASQFPGCTAKLGTVSLDGTSPTTCTNACTSVRPSPSPGEDRPPAPTATAQSARVSVTG